MSIRHLAKGSISPSSCRLFPVNMTASRFTSSFDNSSDILLESTNTHVIVCKRLLLSTTMHSMNLRDPVIVEEQTLETIQQRKSTEFS